MYRHGYYTIEFKNLFYRLADEVVYKEKGNSKNWTEPGYKERVQNMPFRAFSQSHVTDKSAFVAIKISLSFDNPTLQYVTYTHQQQQ